MLERTIEAAVVKHCKARGLYTRKLTSPSNRGMPDRLICGHGRVMFLELKVRGKKLTALQDRERKLLWAAGAHADWADTVQLAIEIIDDYFIDDAVG